MNDEQLIRAVIQTYFDGMYESSADKIRAAFHENATLAGYLPDGFHQMPAGDFAGFVASQQPSPKAAGAPIRLDVVSLDIAGNTAVARVRDDYLGLTFLDTLSFIKVDGRWSIFTKLFHVEGPAA